MSRRIARWYDDLHFWLEAILWVTVVFGGTLALCLVPWGVLQDRPPRRSRKRGNP